MDKFLEDRPNLVVYNQNPRLFYLMGHSWEFSKDDNWELIEKFGEILSKREDVYHATNIEIYDYVQAYKSLQYSADGYTVYNPTLYEIWFDVDGKLYSIKSGETLIID